MKTIPANLAANYTAKDYDTAYALIITRQDAQVFGFTSNDVDQTVDGVACSAYPGLDVSSVVVPEGFAVGNLELTTLHDEAVFTALDVRNGVWNEASFRLVRYYWPDPTDGVEPVLSGTLGHVEVKNASVVVELRDLRQYLQQAIGDPSSKLCRYELGVDDGYGSRCPVDLGPLTVAMTVTSVTSNQVFRDNTRAEAVNYFSAGIITWVTGNNAGLTRKIKSYAANGTFTLVASMLSDVQVGDTATISPGCLKRLSDCRDKFNVVADFGGEPHRPATDDLTSNAVATGV